MLFLILLNSCSGGVASGYSIPNMSQAMVERLYFFDNDDSEVSAKDTITKEEYNEILDLIDRGENVNALGPQSNSLSAVLITDIHVEGVTKKQIVDDLGSRGTNFNLTFSQLGFFDNYSLWSELINFDREVVDSLVQYGLNLNFKDLRGNNILFYIMEEIEHGGIEKEAAMTNILSHVENRDSFLMHRNSFDNNILHHTLIEHIYEKEHSITSIKNAVEFLFSFLTEDQITTLKEQINKKGDKPRDILEPDKVERLEDIKNLTSLVNLLS